MRGKRKPGFNLVALMDIFTILVFFLLVNSSDVQELPSSRNVLLPESLIETKPRETIIVQVASRDILFEGRSIASVDAALADAGPIIEPLRLVLAERLATDPARQRGTAEITIMGDRSIPFELLQRVMATSTEAGFGQVSLAVMQRTGEGDGSL